MHRRKLMETNLVLLLLNDTKVMFKYVPIMQILPSDMDCKCLSVFLFYHNIITRLLYVVRTNRENPVREYFRRKHIKITQNCDG